MKEYMCNVDVWPVAEEDDDVIPSTSDREVGGTVVPLSLEAGILVLGTFRTGGCPLLLELWLQESKLSSRAQSMHRVLK
ncbi:MAG: hypothetical protein NZ789_17540 [Pseudomonadales bacterium]|nr:hypothetical protein [Pseudomonadales bacterium]